MRNPQQHFTCMSDDNSPLYRLRLGGDDGRLGADNDRLWRRRFRRRTGEEGGVWVQAQRVRIQPVVSRGEARYLKDTQA